MVGVCFWVSYIILLISTLSFAKPKQYPEVCSSLGTYIYCASKKLETIPTNIPKWASHLNLNHNSITKLTNINWENLSGLTELILNKNYISSIPKNAFHNQTHLKILELNRNKLKQIEPITFQYLEHLSVLKLKRNEIVTLKDGAFYGLKSIDKLMLDNNYIEVISKGWLYGLESLKELSLTHNKINQIHDDAWEFCSTLTSLNLSFNKLESINEDTFKNLGSLQKLALNNNKISFIKDKAFVHLPKLKILNLSNNKISWAIEDANGVFQGLNDLIKLHLAGNNIKTINANAFVGLKNVSHINLANNNITSIQINAFNKVPLLKQLTMNTTSLLCDCNLKWFLEYFLSKNFKLQAVCAYPEWIRGHSLLEIPANNLTCDGLPKPRLIEEPDIEIMALKGENVTLNCTAMSSFNGPMTFLWKKDNIELLNPDVTIKSRTYPDGKSTESNSELNLFRINNTHAGKYQCVVSNIYGTTYSQKSTISVLVYPTFTSSPKNVTIQSGETAKLECAATGEPQPEVAWHKDGGNDFPAARERRMNVMPNDTVFFIVNAKPSDMGVYSCTAHNAAGTAIANASLVVNEKPYFSKLMENKEVLAGEHVVLQCMAQGLPTPTITWLKDGEPIVPTERHFFVAENKLVVIVQTVQNDSGIYECHLNNSLGEETGRSIIIIKPNTYETTNMMGIIIITVVCCAVFTSIIWVVIIYQTRKRISGQPVQTELPEISDTRAHQQLQLHFCPDNISDHSSCKDSGTGDSAERSSNDLAGEEFTVVINGEAVISSPLLNYSRSTNHDRICIANEQL